MESPAVEFPLTDNGVIASWINFDPEKLYAFWFRFRAHTTEDK